MAGPMIIKTSFVPAGDELEIAYRKWGSPRFGGLPLVPVHGNWSTSGDWTRLAAELTERWLLAPDLRGCGRTRAPDHGFTVAEHAADVLAFLDAMELRRVHLIGHEFGAAVAAELALRHPNRVASLTLISPPSVDGTPPDEAARTQAESWLVDGRAFTAAQAELAPSVTRDMLWATLIEAGQKQRRAALFGNLDALATWKPGDALARIEVPRQVVHGERDAVVSAAQAQRVAQALGCECATFAKVGHHPPLEAPVPLAESIRRLMNQCR